MNEQSQIAGPISIAADRAAAYTDGTVALVQSLLRALPCNGQAVDSPARRWRLLLSTWEIPINYLIERLQSHT